MEQQIGSKHSQPFPMLLEIAMEDESGADPAAIGALGRRLIEDLKQDGYTVEPVYTGMRGGPELILQVMTNLLQASGTQIWTERDAIGILANLCTIFAAASPLVLRLFSSFKKKSVQDHAIKVSLRIDGAEIEIESDDVANDERIEQLAERFLAQHPHTKATPHSQVQMRGQVSQRKSQKHR